MAPGGTEPLGARTTSMPNNCHVPDVCPQVPENWKDKWMGQRMVEETRAVYDEDTSYFEKL